MYLQFFITLCHFVSISLFLLTLLVNCSGSKQKVADGDKTNVQLPPTTHQSKTRQQSNVDSQQPNSTGTSVTVQSARDKTIQKVKIETPKEAVKQEIAPKVSDIKEKAKDETTITMKTVEIQPPLPTITDKPNEVAAVPKVECSTAKTSSPETKQPSTKQSPKITTNAVVKERSVVLRKQSTPALTMKSQPSSSPSRQPAKDIAKGSPKQTPVSSKEILPKDVASSPKASKSVKIVEFGMQAQTDAKSLCSEPTNFFSPCNSAKGEVPGGAPPLTPPPSTSTASANPQVTESMAKLKSEKMKSEKTTTISTENKTPANVVDAEPVSEKSQQSRSTRGLVASKKPREIIRKKRQNKSPPKERSRSKSDRSRSVHDDDSGAVEQIEI